MSIHNDGKMLNSEGVQLTIARNATIFDRSLELFGNVLLKPCVDQHNNQLYMQAVKIDTDGIFKIPTFLEGNDSLCKKELLANPNIINDWQFKEKCMRLAENTAELYYPLIRGGLADIAYRSAVKTKVAEITRENLEQIIPENYTVSPFPDVVPPLDNERRTKLLAHLEGKINFFKYAVFS
jgi:hypothetical protein